jgi:DNA polymerase III epsilon subunit-like protein
VIDIFVIDKAADRYRRGGRKLVDLCTTYQVKHGGAHDATEDALAAGRVAGRLAQRYPRIAAMDLDELHAAQVRWAAEQATSFRQYLYREANQRLHRVDDTTSVEAGDLARQDADQLRTRAEAVDGAWPLRAHPAAVGGGR